MKKALSTLAIVLLFVSISTKIFALAKPKISYSPSSATLTVGTAMTAMTPTNSGGAVASLSYGAGTSITGGGLDHPYGVAVDASGNIYVANYGVDSKDLGSISKYNVSTQTWSTFTTNTIANPSGIAIDNSGNVFVLNYMRTNNGKGNNNGNAYVTEYNSAGTYINTVVQGLGTANGISINSTNGNLDIAQGSYNTGSTQVSEYTTSGALRFTISNANISNPVNVATDGSGNIYVLNNTPNQVVKFSSTGTYISTVVSSGLTNPYGLYVDGSGNIYVSDSTGGTTAIDVYNSSGTFLTSITGLTDPRGVATDSQGNVYVTDFTNNTLTEYAATGGYFISGKLPAGLNFDYTTGTISGTPTVSFSATTYTVTAYNAAGSSSTTVTLTCNANGLLPTITYDPFSVNVFTTNTAITTLTPTVGNSPTSYSISGTLPTGLTFDASTGNISGTPTAVQAATLYTVTATNASGSATTTLSIATVLADYWTGKNSSDWNDKKNWSAKVVPGGTSGYDLASIGVINYTGSDPVISSTEAVSIKYVTFGAANAATLTVQTGGSLTVNNILSVTTNAAPIFSGAGTGATGAINIAPAAVVNVAGTGILTINSGLVFTLQSNATSSAAIDQITSGSIVGQVSVQRYMSAQRGYRLMASPVNYSGVADANGNLAYSLNYVKNSSYVTGTTGTAGGFDKTGNPTLYIYREDVPVNNTSFITGNYRGISNLTAAPTYSLNNEGSPYTIPVSNGFLFYYRGSRKQMTLPAATTAGAAATNDTLTATGYLNQGQIIFRDWYTATSTAPGYSNSNLTAKGFNLTANPYACTIDLDTYNTTTTTSGIYASNISQYIYELNPKTQNYDTYQANSAGKVFTNNGGRYIVSGQGFFVLATGTGGKLIFNETAKYAIQQVTSPNLFMSSKAQLATNVADKPLQMLRLEMAMDTINKDDMMIVFDSNAKSGYVFNEDALYKQGTGKVSLASLSSDKELLAINRMPLNEKTITVPLKVEATSNGTYSLNMNAYKVFRNCMMYG